MARDFVEGDSWIARTDRARDRAVGWFEREGASAAEAIRAAESIYGRSVDSPERREISQQIQ